MNTPSNMDIQDVQEDEQSILDFWTEERMAEAEPIPLPTLSNDQFQELLERNNSLNSLPQDSIVLPGYNPQEEREQEVGAVGVPVQADIKKRPYWNVGKIFMYDHVNDKSYAGSAEFFLANNMVLTAAHCIHPANANYFYTKVVFKRGFKDGSDEQTVTFNRYGVWSPWSQSGNHAYDYGFLRANQTSGAGWLGFITGCPYGAFTSVGYPTNYGGRNYQYQVEGTKGVVAGGIVQMANNPMNGGCSGGAWIGDLNSSSSSGNYAIGLNSFMTNAYPGSMMGPLFDKDTYQLYQDVLK